MKSLLRAPLKPGERLVCYCPPGICQAPKGFSGPCNRAADEPSSTEAELVCYETYAALGTILMDLAERGHPQAEKLLDNLSQAKLVHKDVLPFADGVVVPGAQTKA